MAVKSASMFYVYIIFRLNGIPCYVGKSCRKHRWLYHAKKSHNPHLQNIINKSGGELPVIKTREGLPDSEACETEKALIAAIGRNINGGPLVNMTDGGDGLAGHRKSEETKAKLRTSLAKPEVRKGMSERSLGNTIRRGSVASDETREKLRLSHLGHVQSAEHREKIGAAHKGTKHTFSAEGRARSFAANFGIKKSDAARAKMSASKIGRALTQDHKDKIGAASKKALADPSVRKKLSDATRASWARRKLKVAELAHAQ